MYISGNVSTFQSRQHQLITGADTYNSFMSEFGSYSGLMPAQWRAQRQKEFEVMKNRYGISGASSNHPVVWAGGEAVQSMTASTIVYTDDADAVDGTAWTSTVPSGQNIKTRIQANSVGGSMDWEVYFYPSSVGVPVNIVPFGFTGEEGICTVNMVAPYNGYIGVNCNSTDIGTMITVTVTLSNLT